MRATLELHEPLRKALHTCCTDCMPECCGVDAYRPDPVVMAPWFRANPGLEWQVFDQLADAVHFARSCVGEVESRDYDFNVIWDNGAQCAGYLGLWRRIAVEAYEHAFSRSFPAVEADWLTSSVLALARGIDADRAFDRLPILADALDDAGCSHPDLIDHLRGPGPHARGCWVVDLILGKA
ncbi:MAG: hypothetical protein K2X82_25240 [Gemmataceae bacterium]|nr:hypothetical protein [Gemmataceae bacterium]